MPGSREVPPASPDAVDLTGSTARELDAEFARAMEGPSAPREPGAPPEVDPDAPHGRDDDGQPLAPYGLRNDGRPRLTAAGRPSRDSRSRTAPSGSPAVQHGPARPASWYEEKLTEFGTQMWLLIGFWSPADAGALDQNLQPMAAAWAKGAEADPTIRRAVSWLAEETWITALVATTIPFAAQISANHGRLPERIMARADQEAQRAYLTEVTEQKRQLVFSQMAGAEAA